VLVVGDGVGGLAVAGLLLNRGVRPIVVGTGSERRPAGGVILPPPSVATLDELLLDVSVRAAGRTLRRWTVRDADGCVLASRASTADDSRAGVTLARSRFRQSLVDELPDRTVRPGTTPTRIDQSRSSVEVEFDDGVREQFDVVVAADTSALPDRASVFPDRASALPDSNSRTGTGGGTGAGLGPAGDRDETITWAFETDAAIGAPVEVTEIRLEESVVTSLPVRSGAVVTLSASAACDRRSAAETFASLTARIDCLPATAASDFATRAVGRRRDSAPGSETWRTGRVAFIGDATRAVSRLPGVVTPLALEDAAALVDALVRCETPDDALAAYAAGRQTRVRDLRTGGSEEDGTRSGSPRTCPAALADAIRARDGLFAGYFDAEP
jgi:2-polyprenyl-6-methoxyphenol hydroxylase-like FAD-dependent oxidoreductase